MNFGWFTDDTTDEEIRRTALREFGHALGLIHEHQQPMANIPGDVPRLYAWYSKNQGWDKAKVDANVFAKYDPVTSTSIMQYPMPAGLPKGMLLVRVGTDGPVNWWKSSEIPVVGNGQIEVQTDGIGAHTELGFSWDLMRVLPEGGELQLPWVRDSCRQ